MNTKTDLDIYTNTYLYEILKKVAHKKPKIKHKYHAVAR